MSVQNTASERRFLSFALSALLLQDVTFSLQRRGGRGEITPSARLID